MGSNASAFQATDTSGFVTLATSQTITGEKVFSGGSTLNKLENGTVGGIQVEQLDGTSIAVMRWKTPTRTWQFGAAGATAGVPFPDCWYIFQEGVGARFILNPAGNISIGATPSSGAKLEVQGSVQLGTNATIIQSLRTEKSTMAAGTTGSIADTPVAASSIILVTPEFAPAGRLYYTISAGVGFTILSTDAGDAGNVSWQRITL